MKKRSIAIIGGGPAALSLASFLDSERFKITLFEKNKALGRKFLVAGKGGFNLTHSEGIADLIQRYTPSFFLEEALNSFSNENFRNWLIQIGIPTFVGSSRRVYPKQGIKPIEVLKAIERVLVENLVDIQFNKTWKAWDEQGALLFSDGSVISSDIVVFSLGGGSWRITGSDGVWTKTFNQKGINTSNFQPSNCAFGVNWPKAILEKFSGKPLKNISISCAGKTQKGEVVLSRFGLEGNAIYALSPEIREQLKTGKAKIFIDFKPQFTREVVQQKLDVLRHKNRAEQLKRELKISPLQIALLKSNMNKEEFLDKVALSEKIKSFKIELTQAATLDEAISSVGGVSLHEINKVFELKKVPQHYCIGEMLDWDAPTGGYLLQACFSMGYFLAKNLNRGDNKIT